MASDPDISSDCATAPASDAGAMIQGVIFDFDGLLIDTNALWFEAERASFSAVGVRVTPERQRITAAMTTREVADYWYADQPWTGRTVEQLEQDVISYVRSRLESGGGVMSGALDLVRQCTQRGLCIGLATNAPRDVCIPALTSVGLIEHFDASLTEADVVKGKPHPDVYDACLRALSLLPCEAVALEDSPAGALAARRAGLRVIGM